MIHEIKIIENNELAKIYEFNKEVKTYYIYVDNFLYHLILSKNKNGKVLKHSLTITDFKELCNHLNTFEIHVNIRADEYDSFFCMLDRKIKTELK